MPRLFYPPLVEPGVYVKPKGIQKSTHKNLVIQVGALLTMSALPWYEVM